MANKRALLVEVDTQQPIPWLFIDTDGLAAAYAAAVSMRGTYTREGDTPLQVDANGLVRFLATHADGTNVNAEDDYTQAMQYDASGRLVYHGKALPGTSKATAAWQIRKLTYDANGNVTDVQYAGGSRAFTTAWNNRASATYS